MCPLCILTAVGVGVTGTSGVCLIKKKWKSKKVKS